jgi:hypothetical protein
VPGDPDLTTIIIHADAALRRKRAALEALDRRRPNLDVIPPEIAVGEASQGVISLFLAAQAATRFCSRYPTPGPLGRSRLAAVLGSSRHMRDAVMHWDEKGRRDLETALVVDGIGIAIAAPPLHSNASVVDGLAWKEYETAAQRLLVWARHMIELPADEV